ncbi:ribosome-binding factor A [marine gamma proteobacterium HTCC2207]|jgi:ribosome-binding factor A|uniref:Ribosome-binding factor A n=1 Tax=gamma proteobacterium HTCC2207 TaxID=314287 RepID=Q1YSY1_9GAMM|nr:ribosome-binding factor A [marine gamma proteobacterium HTCC2207] [gamma proteobacterium HTCC2207]MBT5105035.1 30S ribosome-binding factor RbfA [Porticoccaceae bacterium]MDB4428290.1 30S ribosome-binding factor RbfA [Porticoccaceae bacterium]MDC0588186.1 30S ribosome-binding factor RbfA [Porticoccaceae bacterium]MDG1079223.1 30S ribosome-binding factor RbfA [Porticoccaceae bacterium]
MPREFTRAERVSDSVQQELATLIRSEVRDPRVGMVNVTEVQISRDLAYGKVFVNFVGDREQEQIDEAMAALNGASGYLRKLLGASIQLRIVPKLNFIFDETGRRGQHLSALIDLAISKEMPADDAGQQDTDPKDLESDSEEA